VIGQPIPANIPYLISDLSSDDQRISGLQHVWLFPPNRRQPRLLRAWKTLGAVIMMNFAKAGRGDEVAPSF
jgi:hypothetical protein